jgi:hypothetical protein
LMEKSERRRWGDSSRNADSCFVPNLSVVPMKLLRCPKCDLHMWYRASMYKSTSCRGVCSVVKRLSCFNLLKHVCCLFLYPIEVLMKNCSEMWLLTVFWF